MFSALRAIESSTGAFFITYPPRKPPLPGFYSPPYGLSEQPLAVPSLFSPPRHRFFAKIVWLGLLPFVPRWSSSEGVGEFFFIVYVLNRFLDKIKTVSQYIIDEKQLENVDLFQFIYFRYKIKNERLYFFIFISFSFV